MAHQLYDEGDLVFWGRYEAAYQRQCDNPFWRIRLLPDNPYEKAQVVKQVATKEEVYDFYRKCEEA